MAIDPSIPLRALAQTAPPPEGPLDQYAKGLSLQNLMRQGQMGNLQLKEAQDQQKEQDAVKQLFQQDMPAEQRLQKLYTISPTYAAQYQKALADAQKANADIGKTTADTAATNLATKQKALDAVGGLAQAAKAKTDPQLRQQTWINGLQQIDASGVFKAAGIDINQVFKQPIDDSSLDSLIGTVTSAKDQMTQAREQAQFTETQRHNQVGETETNRHNQVGEQDTLLQRNETARHNLQTETQAQKALAETGRHNQAGEGDTMTLTPEGLDVAATAFAKTGQLPAMGQGKAGAAARSAIINRAAELNPKLDVAANKADYGANKTSLEQATKLKDALASFENTALQNMKILEASGKKVLDSGSPMLNQPLRAIDEKALGSTELPVFRAARQIVVNEVAKLTGNPNLSGQLSDSARDEISKILPPDMTLPQLMALLPTLRQDMKNRTGSLDQQIGAIRDRIKGGGSGDTSNSATQPKVGEVRKGYVYMGGDPSQPGSWKKEK